MLFVGRKKTDGINNITTKDIGSKTGHIMESLRQLSWYHTTELDGIGPGLLHSALSRKSLA